MSGIHWAYSAFHVSGEAFTIHIDGLSPSHRSDFREWLATDL